MSTDPNDRSARAIRALDSALEDAEAVRDYKAVLEITDKLKALGGLQGVDGVCPTCGYHPEVDAEIAELVEAMRRRG